MTNRIIVLLAEDEDLIRELIAETLRAEGFEVIESQHAEHAFGTLQARADDIHVLFTDIHMPGSLNGLELAHHTARKWPWIALLITSARPAPDRSHMPRKCRFLPKPYRHDHVVRHIRELVAA
jgi:two-component system, response regulator PdtaR